MESRLVPSQRFSMEPDDMPVADALARHLDQDDHRAAAIEPLPVKVTDDEGPLEDFWDPLYVALALADAALAAKCIGRHAAACAAEPWGQSPAIPTAVGEEAQALLDGLAAPIRAVLPDEEEGTAAAPAVVDALRAALATFAAAKTPLCADAVTCLRLQRSGLCPSGLRLRCVATVAKASPSGPLGAHLGCAGQQGHVAAELLLGTPCAFCGPDLVAAAGLTDESSECIKSTPAEAERRNHIALRDVALVAAALNATEDEAAFRGLLAARSGSLATLYTAFASPAAARFVPAETLHVVLRAVVEQREEADDIALAYLLGAVPSKAAMQHEVAVSIGGKVVVPRSRADMVDQLLKHQEPLLPEDKRRAWVAAWDAAFAAMAGHGAPAVSALATVEADPEGLPEEALFYAAEAAESVTAVAAARAKKHSEAEGGPRSLEDELKDEATPLPERFERAVQGFAERAEQQPNKCKLLFYGLYKQATVGDVTGSRPWAVDLKGCAKYDAWAAQKGTSKEAAMQKYMDALLAL